MSKNYVAYGSDQQEGQVKLGQNGESHCVYTVGLMAKTFSPT
jgi:hypothetical protein